jgi:hypothetical protein
MRNAGLHHAPLIWINASSAIFGHGLGRDTEEACMKNGMAKSASSYLRSPARTLREACEETGHDEDGKRCPVCPVKDLCESEERWVVELAPRSRPV